MMAGTTDNQFYNHLTTRLVYVAPLATGVVYDPVTNVRWENVAAMNFSAQKGPSSASAFAQKPAYYAAALRVGGAEANQAEATQPTDAITVECFVRTTATGKDFNGLAPIFAKRNGWSWKDKESWTLYMGSEGKLVVRLNGQSYGENKEVGTYFINDGKWHHVALTYSSSDGALKVYVDYRLDKSHATGGGAIAYDANTGTPNLHALWIGGTSDYGTNEGRRTFPGDIDELRISDTALKPEEFLRLETPDANAYRLTFDAAPANAWSDTASKRTFLDTSRRVSDGLFLSAWLKCTDEKNKPGSVLYDPEVKYANTLRDGVFSNAMSNAAAVEFQPKTEGGRYVKVENFTKEFFGNQRGSFTVECFFKTRGQVRDASQTILQIGSTPTMKVLFNANDQGAPLYYCWNAGKWAGAPSERTDNPDDGQWHHVAFVYDEAAKRVRCYLDYRLDKAVCVTNALDTNASLMVGGAHVGKDKFGQCFDGWIDDVRVTKAALSPEEFLCTHDVAVKADDPTRLFAAFDNNNETGPYLPFTGCWENGPAGEGGADAGFGLPRTSRILLGGEGAKEKTPNLASLELNGAAVGFDYSRLYEQDAFTVEFFGRFRKVDLEANIIRYSSGIGDGSYTNRPVWAVYRDKNAKEPTLQFCLSVTRNGKEVEDFAFRRAVPDLEDGRWHHYAITFEPTADGENTRIVLYRDYRKVYADGDAEEVAGRLNFAKGAGGRLLLNSAAKDNKQVIGLYDSLRFSAGVLPPEKFIRKISDGLALILR